LADYAREFGAGDPGERRLMLILAADLEEVEEVCGGCVDGDEVLVWFWDGVGEGCYFEIGGALDVFFDLDAAHCDGCSGGKLGV